MMELHKVQDMAEISLLIDGQMFKAKKEVLCAHSDYFRAMFSGNYVENNKKEITLDAIDAESMKTILQYMNTGLIDLTEYPISTIAELMIAASFLQITELIKQIECTLELQISPASFIEIMIAAQNSGFTQIEQLSATHGLLNFKSMKPEYIPNIIRLCWYLSHPYLDATSELDVFNFGNRWLLQNETGVDALLIILGCLDVKKLTLAELSDIKTCMLDYQTSLAAKVIDCLHNLAVLEYDLTEVSLQSQATMLQDTYTERIYNEVLSLVKESKSRLLSYTPVVPMKIFKDCEVLLVPHCLYTFSEKVGFENWLEVVEKNLCDWSMVAWGPTRLVVVCGEHGKYTGRFMNDVKVYDVVKKEWTHHGVELPARKKCGVAVVNDSLYIIGGANNVSTMLNTAIIYDLKRRSFREIARLPHAKQHPAVCVHEGSVFAADLYSIYKYDDTGDTDRWITAVNIEVCLSFMISYKGHIYCTYDGDNYVYRFKPGQDTKLERITSTYEPPATICNVGNRLLFFTRCGNSFTGIMYAEEYTGKTPNEKPNFIWHTQGCNYSVNYSAGSCTLVTTVPPLYPDTSNYMKKYLKRYETA